MVKVDKFTFPMDFVVLSMEENTKAPLILGRPFIATGQVLIDVKNGELTLKVGEDHVKFSLYRSLKFSNYVRAV